MLSAAHLASDIFWLSVLAFGAACTIYELSRAGRQ